MDGSIFKHDGKLGGIFPGFVWDRYRITLELSRDLKCNHISIIKGSQQHLDTTLVRQNLGYRKIACKISFSQINKTTNYPGAVLIVLYFTPSTVLPIVYMGKCYLTVTYSVKEADSHHSPSHNLTNSFFPIVFKT